MSSLHDELSSKTITQLRRMVRDAAKDVNLAKYSKLNKAELIEYMKLKDDEAKWMSRMPAMSKKAAKAGIKSGEKVAFKKKEKPAKSKVAAKAGIKSGEKVAFKKKEKPAKSKKASKAGIKKGEKVAFKKKGKVLVEFIAKNPPPAKKVSFEAEEKPKKEKKSGEKPKRERSAKQLANDKRLGEAARARAAAKKSK